MIRLVFAACLLATTAHAETCQAPNVARVIEGVSPSALFTNDLINRPSVCELACPAEGPCHHVCQVDPPPLRVVCLTPTENEAAEARGR